MLLIEESDKLKCVRQNDLTNDEPPVLNCRFAFIARFSSEVHNNVETLRSLRQGTSVWSHCKPRQQPHQPPLQSKPAGRPSADQRPRATDSRLHAMPEGGQSRQSCLTDV